MKKLFCSLVFVFLGFVIAGASTRVCVCMCACACVYACLFMCVFVLVFGRVEQYFISLGLQNVKNPH